MSAGDWKELYKASLEGNLELAQYHLKNKVDPNYQHPEILSTPLMAAISSGHLELVRLLLNHNSDPFLITIFEEMNAFEYSEACQQPVILDFLVKRYNYKKPSLVKRIFKKLF